MDKKIILPLNIENRSLVLDTDKVKYKKEELELFLLDEDKMHSRNFANKVLLYNEVQSNNSVEGYYDDIEKIKQVVSKSKTFKNKSDKDKTRIINLYNGYNFISDQREITKENLKKLYNILSNGLLDDFDIKNMGEFYRNNPVYIYYSDNIDINPDTGLLPSEINKCMDELFSFINGFNMDNTITDEYIKSQIMHFYFVYIHPYYDINGRTSRTMSIWHLLNKKAYPYVIFNRGIQLNKNKYYNVIRDVKRFSNISFFVNYMMETVLIELEKEHIIQCINEINNLTEMDYQTIHYLLSMKGLKTVCDFSNLYNKYNIKKRPHEIYDEMVLPLVDKKILVPGRITSNHFASDKNNFVLEFNKTFIDDNPNKIKHLKI